MDSPFHCLATHGGRDETRRDVANISGECNAVYKSAALITFLCCIYVPSCHRLKYEGPQPSATHSWYFLTFFTTLFPALWSSLELEGFIKRKWPLLLAQPKSRATSRSRYSLRTIPSMISPTRKRSMIPMIAPRSSRMVSSVLRPSPKSGLLV